MRQTIRPHRVDAMTKWLSEIPLDPPFHTRPEFRFFDDLNGAEINAVSVEMQRRWAENDNQAEDL